MQSRQRHLSYLIRPDRFFLTERCAPQRSIKPAIHDSENAVR